MTLFARLPGGGESRDVWKLGPLCVKRWSPRIPPADVRRRCRVSRDVPVCNSMWYVPWLHWTLARWVHGQPAAYQDIRALQRLYRLRDLSPGNVLVCRRRGPLVLDFGVPPHPRPVAAGALGRVAQRAWHFVRVARLPGGGESRDVWKLGPLCIKRWSPRIPPADVRRRCRVSRELPVCNSMWYVPWLHWTLARWCFGQPATHDACNALLAAHPFLRDLHPGNVLVVRGGRAVIIDARL